MELVTPGSAVRFASVVRHVTDCAMWPVSYRASISKSMQLQKFLYICYKQGDQEAPDLTVTFNNVSAL